jgi:cyclophilin family peptidyl-prolyl cis-trans isomerase/HEAT repeat protein
MIATAFVAAFLVMSQAVQKPPGVQRPIPPVPIQQPRLPQGVTHAGGEPDPVLVLEKQWAGSAALMPLLSAKDTPVSIYALRAIGRLQDPDLVPSLMTFATTAPTLQPHVARAIAQSLFKFDPAGNPALIDSVFNWLLPLASSARVQDADPYLVPLARIVWARSDQVHRAEHVFVDVMEKTADSPPMAGFYQDAVVGLELVAHLDSKTARFEDPTIERLASVVAKTAPNDGPMARFKAFGALLAAGAVDQATIKTALKDDFFEIRRRAVTILAGTSVPLGEDERISLILERLQDPSANVRFEAVRAYASRRAPRGCATLLDMLDDHDSHVVLKTLDAIGDACQTDEEVVKRLAAEVRTPPATGAWNRETHAFVALAKRSPDAASIVMGAFATHPNWWVRMYAVQAAAVLDDTVRLQKLAYDDNENVVNAALGQLHRMKVPDWDRAVVAALSRSDVQLLHTAAEMLKGLPQDDKLASPLVDALLRLTSEGKETSRDARVSLLEAIARHGNDASATRIETLLRDFDPVVASRTAEVMTHLTGKTAIAQPTPILRGWPQEFTDSDNCVAVELQSGPMFLMVLDLRDAPITVDRFLHLAVKDHYYDGTTIQRVEPNFVIQGGSPAANEYSGHHDFMRDEVAGVHTRGSVGLSNRGPNTNDAQFFVDLVDNSRLDYQYTVFAHVMNMDIVDAIEEGATIKTIKLLPGSGPQSPCARTR